MSMHKTSPADLPARLREVAERHGMMFEDWDVVEQAARALQLPDDWVAGVFVSNNGVDMALEVHVACKLPDGPHKLYAHPAQVPEAEAVRLRREAFMAGVAWQKEMEAPPQREGVPEAEAVAWRWKCKGVEQPWYCTDDARFIGWILENKKKYVVDELYASPPPVAAPSGEAVASKLGKWMAASLDDPNVCAEMKADIEAWFKSGEPSLASDPKDAGSGEGQELSWEEQDRAIQAAIVRAASLTNTLRALHSYGYRIVRTAPSGAKPPSAKPEEAK